MTRPPAGRLRRAIDALIGRSTSAAPVTAVRRFDAARIDRLSADFQSTLASINQELRGDLDRLRARGRHLANNNDYARKFVGMVQDNIIGPSGIVLQSRIEDRPGSPDTLANNAIESAWREFCAACDITGRMSMRDLCAQLVGGLPSDGEFLVRIVRGPDARNRFGIALQAIDVDRIDTRFNGTAVETGNTVIMGVEVDSYRRPVAMHLFVSHPNDGITTSRQRTRVPMDDLVHGMRIDRAEQARGVPWMAPGMLSLHHLGGFMLSALMAAEHGANHYGFFTTPDGGPPPIANEGADGLSVAVSQPGTYDTLPAGTSFQPHESKYPNEVFAPFVKTVLQRIASGWRVAYHSLANDLEGVSFSSIRSGTIEERDRWAGDQEWFIATFMEPVFNAWIQTALMSGAIVMPNGSTLPSSKLAKFSRHQWQPRRWEWVDPKNDMESRILAVRAGLIPPQDISASMGYDFEDVIVAIGQAQQLAKDNNVQLTAYDPTPGAAGAAKSEPSPAPAPAPSPDPSARVITDLADNLRGAMSDVRADIKDLQRHVDERMAAQTDLARTMVPVVAALGALAAREQPTPIVNVQAGDTHTHIADGAVRVANHVQTPVLASRQTIKRDADGDIAEIVTTPNTHQD